ncbi:MAG: class I SAM-dependent methyltransferase [Flavobacteriaceae bacterium]|nr:class I SAM-dependent methyltransferase [Flavobacteriaceae bacterium]
MPENIQWFESWFDTSYYHLLYANRDENEARHFLGRLTDILQIPKCSKILDLACGKGRHSIYLHSKGFEVKGVDLSENSITKAKEETAKGLSFGVHDMRQPLPDKFNYIFSLFTSFGYFEKIEEDQAVLNAVGQMLMHGGIFVLDFLNAAKVKNDIASFVGLDFEREGIHFSIEKKISSGRVQKEIVVNDGSKTSTFNEFVRLYTQTELISMLNKARLEPFDFFGNYELGPFNQNESERLLIFARKKR